MNDPFRVQVDQANHGAAASLNRSASSSRPVDGPGFAETLAQAQDIHFSTHAAKRLQNRDIQINEENVTRLADAIDKAEQRGGKSSLVLMDDLAFIVNVQDRLVVTAMNANQRGQGVFTRIDSVVFADAAGAPSRSLIDTKG